MLNKSNNKENINTPLENEKDDILSEILASGKKISFPDFNFYKIRTFCGVLVQIKDTFQNTMRIPTGIVLYAVNPNN
ncbi:hypothetical protein [Bacillus cereus]|uniref:Uncharacterized protein n=1 Tax=Bacillus cereus HuA4-10 TaxID=1053206 RepID=J8CVS7_BACCE|nr:hypothetical protein [Bacillus cereus]EJQ71392.1 hypothetical protein IGC_05675 [Bacillus cereus HuA4-10]